MRAATGAAWLTARGAVSLDRPCVVGILNVTPDSFWDGGLHAGVEAAVVHAGRLLADGADLLDVGGESTRPGAQPVPPAEEIARVVPVVQAVVRAFPDALLSVDTMKADVARTALAEGAAIVNDVSGLRLDPGMSEVVRESGAGVIVMHSRGGIETMARYTEAVYGPDPAADVARELAEALDRARAAGIPDEAVVLDPGFGFSKRTEHSIAVLAHLDRILALGRPVLVGPSRKRFVGEAAGTTSPEDRLPGTIAACVVALLRGARLFRVHDVLETRRALALAEAVRTAP
ncbi:MAG TPA: dihydropteroate synthase [Longimicrobiales bacterium]|nr:dihydropteroate synthase [Longimicrobiales bacterium]